MTQKLICLVTAILIAMTALAACHTVEGAGEDVKSGGRALERATGE